ncbi:MAG: hypothetical protein CL908_07100 [Deltaproteobacteria bacterium]|nr:hypothetical protein [Deltaproteobacteria bacterium]
MPGEDVTHPRSAHAREADVGQRDRELALEGFLARHLALGGDLAPRLEFTRIWREHTGEAVDDAAHHGGVEGIEEGRESRTSELVPLTQVVVEERIDDHLVVCIVEVHEEVGEYVAVDIRADRNLDFDRRDHVHHHAGIAQGPPVCGRGPV